MPSVTGLLCPSALKQFSSRSLSSCWRSAFPSPHSLVRPSSINGKYKTTGIFKTPCQLIFSFVFRKRKLERIEGISASLEGVHITKYFFEERKEARFWASLLLSVCDVWGTFFHVFRLTLSPEEEELCCSEFYRWGDWLLEHNSLSRNLEINCSTFGKW